MTTARLRACAITAAWLLFASSAFADDAGSSASDCLFATSDDGNVLIPCPDDDPLNLGTDPKLGRAMRALGIDPTEVRFKGCNGLIFAALLNPSPETYSQRYLVTYPTNVGADYLAPAVHELAHVLQLEVANGSMDLLRKNRKQESLRIELEADYLTGLVFQQALADEGVVAFQQNLILTGLFKEEHFEAHGSGAQRTGAFRIGYLQKLDEDVPDMKTAALHFQANLYVDIARSR